MERVHEGMTVEVLVVIEHTYLRQLDIIILNGLQAHSALSLNGILFPRSKVRDTEVMQFFFPLERIYIYSNPHEKIELFVLKKVIC